MSAGATVSLVVPTLNEAENVEPLLRRVLATGAPLHEIVFVDDGSRDGTRERVRSLVASVPVRLVARDQPTLGLAGAVVAGARAATGQIVALMDADLSHPPEKLPELVGPILRGEADLVIGSRYVPGGTTPGWPLWRRIMSRAGGLVSYPLTSVHDSGSGFFAIWRERLLEFAPDGSGFKAVFQILLEAEGRLRVREIPIAFRDRERGSSKMSFKVALLFAWQWFGAVGRRLRKRLGCERLGIFRDWRRAALVPLGALFVGEGELEQAPFVQGPAHELEADRQGDVFFRRGESAGKTEPAKTGEVGRVGEEVAEIKLERIGPMPAEFVGGRRGGRG